MEFAEVVRRRRMVRSFDPDRPVPAEVLQRLLSYATHAPSAGFAQGFEFLVLEAEADRAGFWEATTPPGRAPSAWSTGMRTAPLLVIPHSHKAAYLDRYAEPDKGWTDRAEDRWAAPYWDIDTGFASLLILLGVVDEGLGACFFGIPTGRLAAFAHRFGVPEEYRPIGAIAIGYRAADRPGRSAGRARRTVGEITHRGRWEDASAR